MKKEFFKFISITIFFLSISCDLVAQNIYGTIINSLHDPRGLHLNNTKIYSQSDLNGFIRLSGKEANNSYLASRENMGERVVYYNGTYDYEISQGNNTIHTGTFLIDLDVDFAGK